MGSRFFEKFSWFRFKSQFVIVDDDETMDPISITITNPNYRMDIISLTLATGIFKKFFLHLYETYCFHFKLFEGPTNAVRWKRRAALLVILNLLLFLKSLHFGAIFAPFSSYIHLMSLKWERNRSWIATPSPALLFFAMLSCHLPSPNL